MAWKIFIENLGTDVTASDVSKLLSQHCKVRGIELSKGKGGEEDDDGEETQVAFVEVKSGKDGRAAIAALDGKEHGGRTLSVSPLKGHGGGLADSSSGWSGSGPGSAGRGRRGGVFGGKGGAFGHKNRGKGGGRGS